MSGWDFASILSAYTGSAGDRTKALYEQLAAHGPLGAIAINLFRACKASERAKVYRGGVRGKGSFRRMAYDRKSWALDQLIAILREHAEEHGIVWGWGQDTETIGFNWVLYVELPDGQVSFHSPHRGSGPDYPRAWDGVRGVAGERVCRFCSRLLADAA